MAQRKTKKQASTKSVDPVFTISDLETKKSELNDQVSLLKRRRCRLKLKNLKNQRRNGIWKKLKKPKKLIIWRNPKTKEETHNTEHAEENKSDKAESDRLPEDLVEERFEL